MAKLYSPRGVLIIGTADTVLVTAEIINEDITRNEDGTIAFEYAGDSEVHWDTQEIQKDDDGHDLFYDKDGQDWPENKLLILTDEEWEERFGEDVEAEDEGKSLKVQVPAEIVDDVIRALVSSGTPGLEEFAQLLKDQRFKQEA